jgi:hypothetical protein
MLLDSPLVLFGTESHIASQLERLGTEHGVSYVTTFEHSSEPLATATARMSTQ